MKIYFHIETRCIRWTETTNGKIFLINTIVYDYHIHKWVYNVKYYLNGDDWCLDPEGTTILRKINERELGWIEKYKDLIEERERENVAWINQKQCRKRSFVCKKCEKYYHCYGCVDKINVCDFVQGE